MQIKEIKLDEANEIIDLAIEDLNIVHGGCQNEESNPSSPPPPTPCDLH